MNPYTPQHLVQAVGETAAAAGLSRDAIQEHVLGDLPMDLVRTNTPAVPVTAGSHYDRSAGPSNQFVLVPAGEAVADELERVPLHALVVTRAEDIAAAERVSNAGRMSPEAQTEAQEERERLAAEQGRVLVEATDPARLADISLEAVAHMRLPDEQMGVIKQAVEAGSAGERERQELYLLRRFVEGPTGEVEPSYSLHRWSPAAPRPKRGAFGAGSDTFSIAELLNWAGEREEVRALHGADAAQAHGWGSDAFKDRGLEKAQEL